MGLNKVKSSSVGHRGRQGCCWLAPTRVAGPVAEMVNFCVQVGNSGGSSFPRTPITPAPWAPPLQACQVSLEPRSSKGPGRLSLGSGTGETGVGCRGEAGSHGGGDSPGQKALKGVCCIVGFTSPLHYPPKDKNRVQKQQRMCFLFCFYISWRNSRCLSTHGNSPVCGPGGLGGEKTSSGGEPGGWR